jgi:lysozyme
MASITASVGAGSVNQPADVAQVQSWLNAKLNAGLTVDGQCGPLTIKAIETFQATVRGVTAPDGVISPNGPTLAALAAQTAPAPTTGAAAVNAPVIANTATTLLVDLSHNNNPLPANYFAALQQAGVGAVLLKASQGASFKDATFATRCAGAQAASLLVGAYHFGTGEAVADQLNNFVAAIAAAGTDFTTVAAAIDVEPNPADHANPPAPPHTMSVDQAEAFVAGFRARANALPLVYGGAGYLGYYGGATNRPNLAACPLWIAEYPARPGKIPGPLAGWAAWALWQYTSGGLGCYAGPVAGLNCDQSIFLGTPAELNSLWGTLRAAAVA